ncbi:MAG TPA: hypothetical protein VD971_06915 [Phycisphaerales bacterium]|nr:hypothetical protein [Phycisphaerales bacterium]
MTPRHLLLVLVRCIGLIFVLAALPAAYELVHDVAQAVMMRDYLVGRFSLNVAYGYRADDEDDFLRRMGPVLQFLAGLYLVIGARRLTMRMARVFDASCLVCGYNLRGVRSDACPECGTKYR